MKSPPPSIHQDDNEGPSFQLDFDLDLEHESLLDLEHEYLQPSDPDPAPSPLPPHELIMPSVPDFQLLNSAMNEATLSESTDGATYAAMANMNSCVGAEKLQASPLSNHAGYRVIPLQQWIFDEVNRSANTLLSQDMLNLERACALRKVTVAYAIGVLLGHIQVPVSSYSQVELQSLCSSSNFSVHMNSEVAGIEMVSPSMFVQISPGSFLSSSTFANDESFSDRNINVAITRHCEFCCAHKPTHHDTKRSKSLCYSFGLFLHYFFSGDSLGGDSIDSASSDEYFHEYGQPRPAKTTCKPTKTSQLMHVAYTSVSKVIKNLLDCHLETELQPTDTYTSFDEAVGDLKILVTEPTVFLFDYENTHLHKIEKLYGRRDEMSALSNAFCRVASSGKSEAFTIGGYSGSGKTRLVSSISDCVVAANGIFFTAKFEESTSSPLTIVLSAFNDLCLLLECKNSQEDSHHIFEMLKNEFGSNLFLLVRAVPNVLRLASSDTDIGSLINDAIHDNEVNFFSLCDILQRFMKIVSSPSSPVLFLCDDLQWADPTSLGVVHTVLTNKQASILFVGTYRHNEVSSGHIMFDFCEWLSKFNITLTNLSLDGMSTKHVNAMVSDSLGIFPRLCKPLAEIVHRKTKGNPLFAQTFLRSLVDKKLLTFSLREKSWTWNLAEILAEDITPNVLDLLSSKLTNLSDSVQTALKVASCFGIKIDASVVNDLSCAPCYFSINSDLNRAVEDGLLDLDADGGFRFAHDSVRKAAYDSIPSGSIDRFHFDLGMILLASRENRMGQHTSLLTILGQVNRGIHSSLLRIESERIKVTELNYEAALEAMLGSNFTVSYHHASICIKLLPADSWQAHHDLCLKTHSLLSKAAFSNRQFQEAKDAANKVIEHSNSLQVKLDAYSILHSILLIDCDSNDAIKLLNTIIDLLESLGEHMPEDDEARKDVANQVRVAVEAFETDSDHNLLYMYKTGSCSSHVAIMQAYNILASLAYISKQQLYPYYVSRWVQFCLKYKVASKHVSVAYASFAAIVCQKMNDNIILGRRIGQLGLKMLDQSESYMSELPLVYVLYYGSVGIFFEPIQSVIEMHRKAAEVGYQLGSLSLSAMHKVFQVAREFHSGKNLLKMKEDTERDTKSEEYHTSFPLLGMKLHAYHKAVTTLMGESIPEEPDKSQVFDSEPSYIITQMAALTYLGYFERVNHMGKRWEAISGAQQCKKLFNLRLVYVYFYWGLSALTISKRRQTKWSEINRLLSVVTNAAAHSSWNFQNKAELLKAERLSLCSHNRDAEASYATAIASAQSSRFIHEEGLACEREGLHYQRLKEFNKAIRSFQQAEQCYDKWGSPLKVRKMQENIANLSAKMGSK